MKQLQTDPHVQDFIEIIPHRDGIDPDGYSIGVLSDEDKKCSIGWLVNDVGNVFKYLPNLPELVEFYRVSDKTSYLLNRDGEVFSYNNKLHKLRPVRTRDDGSLSLKIYDNKGNKSSISLWVSFYVAKIFGLPNPMGYRFIRHKDGDLKNSSLDNLEWVPERNTKYFNFNDILVESKKYKTTSEFYASSRYAFLRAQEMNWIDKLPIKNNSTKSWKEHNMDYVVYLYEFVEDLSVYVGICESWRKTSRHTRHIKDENSAVNRHSKETGFQIPIPIYVKNDISMFEAQYYENFYKEYYKNLGRNVLNIGPTGIGVGSVGGCSREISNEQMEKEYTLFSDKTDLRKRDPKLYESLRHYRKDLYNQIPDVSHDTDLPIVGIDIYNKQIYLFRNSKQASDYTKILYTTVSDCARKFRKQDTLKVDFSRKRINWEFMFLDDYNKYKSLLLNLDYNENNSNLFE